MKVYVCNECLTYYSTYEEAEGCCVWEQDDAPIVTTEEVDDRTYALMAFNDDYDPSNYEEGYNVETIEYGKKEYLVVTDSEADDLWEEDLDNYIEECVLCELPERYQMYFDNEAFKRDCRYDGRAHSLARYDGNEYEERVNGTTYYIYRQN